MRHVYAAKPHVIRNMIQKITHKGNPSDTHLDPRKNELKKEEKQKEPEPPKPKPPAQEEKKPAPPVIPVMVE